MIFQLSSSTLLLSFFITVYLPVFPTTLVTHSFTPSLIYGASRSLSTPYTPSPPWIRCFVGSSSIFPHTFARCSVNWKLWSRHRLAQKTTLACIAESPKLCTIIAASWNYRRSLTSSTRPSCSSKSPLAIWNSASALIISSIWVTYRGCRC